MPNADRPANANAPTEPGWYWWTPDRSNAHHSDWYYGPGEAWCVEVELSKTEGLVANVWEAECEGMYITPYAVEDVGGAWGPRFPSPNNLLAIVGVGRCVCERCMEARIAKQEATK